MRVTVIGAGRSGLAAARLLASRGARVVLSDTREQVEAGAQMQQAGIALELGGHRPETVTTSDLVVISPGVPSSAPIVRAACDAGVPVIGELELASRWLQGRIVAVTGTKGKSTTVTLAGRMLEHEGRRVTVGGNLGVALSQHVDASMVDSIHLVEVSSFQLETIETFHPWMAVLLNLSPDHLDRHGTEAAYLAAKARVVENQAPDDWTVVNADDPGVLEIGRRSRARQLRFACDADLDEGIVVADDAITHRTAAGDSPLVPLAAVRLRGRHLLSDVLAAAAVGLLVGVSADAMTRAVESFRGLEHALEPAGEVDGVAFVDDSKATNVAAAVRAIESFGGDLVVLLGGHYKGGDLRALRAPLERRARAVVVLGESRDRFREALRDAVPIYQADSMRDAVRAAYGLAPPGGTVLLAPACASFDMFESYAARGRAFKQEVAALATERSREQ
jgi:UDP-N-acetylmuramoylalanine--D-glutamate ligase